MNVPGWRTVTKDEPCRACGKGDWCGRAVENGAIHCRRFSEPPSGFEFVKATDSGTVFRPIGSRVAKPNRSPISIVRNDDSKLRDFGAIVEELRNRSAASLEEWAALLGVRAESLERFGAFVVSSDDLRQNGFGFGGGPRPDLALAWPEYDGAGVVRGIAARTRDDRKGTATGSKRGIARPLAPLDPTKPKYCCEGASDAWALDSLGLQAFARPNNSARKQVETWLADFLRDPRGPLFFVLDRKEGEKSIPLVESLAVKLRRSIRYGYPPDEASDCREWLRARTSGGLDLVDTGARKTAGLEFEASIERTAKEVLPPQGTTDATRTLADIVARPIAWVWPRVLALGFATLIAGRHGSSKSTLLAYIAATVTRGKALPGGSEFQPRSVLLIAGEDREAETLRPRIEAAGGDPSRVILPPPNLVRGGTLAEILSWAADGKRIPSGSLVLVDPISCYVEHGFTDNETTSVRSLLAMVEGFAERNEWAIAFVKHPNKSSEGPARLRVAGSGAWIDAPRISWLVAPDPDCESRRYLVPLKLNVGSDREGFAFEIEIRDVAGADRQPVVSAIESGVTRTADEILAANDATPDDRSELDRARDWLDDELPPGSSKPSKALRDAARKLDIYPKTLTRAAKRLGVDMRKSRADPRGKFNWSRPFSGPGPSPRIVPNGVPDTENPQSDREFALRSLPDKLGARSPERNEGQEQRALGDSSGLNDPSGQIPREVRNEDPDEIINYESAT